MVELRQHPWVRRAQYDQHRRSLRAAFAHLSDVPRLPWRKFVLAHVLAPHPPFVFGPGGEPIDTGQPFDDLDASHLLRRMTREEYRTRYTGQLQYINRLTLEAIDAILRRSPRPPIIIVQGDHGSRLNLDWESLARTDLREPFSILNAYHVPGGVRGRLYDEITPVNTFRLLLTQLFGAAYPPLPDRSFYSTATRPYEFTEVAPECLNR